MELVLVPMSFKSDFPTVIIQSPISIHHIILPKALVVSAVLIVKSALSIPFSIQNVSFVPSAILVNFLNGFASLSLFRGRVWIAIWLFLNNQISDLFKRKYLWWQSVCDLLYCVWLRIRNLFFWDFWLSCFGYCFFCLKICLWLSTTQSSRIRIRVGVRQKVLFAFPLPRWSCFRCWGSWLHLINLLKIWR